jgi:hypothetical protein
MSRISPPRNYTDRDQPPSRPGPTRRRRRSRRDRLIELWEAIGPRLLGLGICLIIEIILMLIALVPQNIWATLGFPSGPIPDVLAPVVAGAFYILPTLTGALCRRWMVAVVLATLPAWLDLCVFAIASAMHIGPFYLETDPHATGTVGTLELFAVLGALGWLARTGFLSVWKRRKGKR